MKFKRKDLISRVVSVALSASMLMCSGLATAGSYIAQGIIASAADITVVESGSCGADGDNVTYMLDDRGTLTISGNGKMKDYNNSSVPVPAPYHNVPSPFEYNEDIKKVIIKDGVTTIGNDAFYNCSSLASLEIPDSVTKIGGGAFYNCSSLASLEIPDSVTKIGGGAFYNCSSLVSLEIPDSVTEIGNDAFCRCNGLTSLEIPDSVTIIGDFAFRYCTRLTSIEIPDSLKYIGVSAFENTIWYKNQPDGLIYAGKVLYEYKGKLPANTSIKLNDDTIGISGYAFAHCAGLTNIDIPNSVTEIGNGVFKDCTDLTNITIPGGVTQISNYLFDGCTGLTSVDIPDGVTAIGSYAFSDCTGLTSITVPDNVTSIGGGAFSGCTGLTSITIPNGVTSIGRYAFSGCTDLASITIPNDVTSIGWYAFSGCTDLASITIPNSVTSIGWYAFKNCSSLKDVYYSGTEEEWSKIHIGSDNESLTEAKLHCNIDELSLEEELLYKTKLYTSDGGELYRKVRERLNKICADENVSQENKINALKGFYEMFNIMSVQEGTEYCTEETNAKRAYDYLTNDDVFLAYNFKWWLHNTKKGTVARGLMITNGWIFNDELKQYIDPKTYINQETVDIKNYKAMLLSFLNYKADDGIVGDVNEVLGYANKVRKYLASLSKYIDDEVLEQVTRDFVKAVKDSPKMSADEMEDTLNAIYKKHNVMMYLEGDQKNKIVHHLEGFPELKKALGVAGNVFKITSTALSDVMMFIQVEEKLETIERYRTFLEKVAAGKDYLPGDLVIAAQQLLDQTISPYHAEIKKFVLDVFDCVDGVYGIGEKIKSAVTSEIKKKFPLLFQGKFAQFTGTFGDALAVIGISAVVSDAITNIGTVVKEETYVEAYAYLGQYFKVILDEKKNQFNSKQNVDNAWEFYDMYNLLFRIRACGENTYLKMCQTSAVTSILANVGFKSFDITDRKKYVEDTFEYMNEYCFFGLENADQIPESHKFAQKAVIKCPVDVEIYDNSGKLVYKIFDGKEIDDTNTLGRFICKYDSKLGEYIKIMCLNNPDKYTIKSVGVDCGNVNIETAVVGTDNAVTASKVTGLPIERNGIITLDIKTGNYTDDQNGDGSNEYTGKLQKTDIEEIIPVKSIKLSDKTVDLKVGEKKVVGVIVNPTNATFTDVVWESSDESIAVAENGAIKGISAGKAKITVSTSDRKIISSCTVTVKGDRKFGDTNGDGKATIADSLMIARYEVKLRTLTDEQLAVSDVNYDGKVTIADALKIARYEVKLINKL